METNTLYQRPYITGLALSAASLIIYLLGVQQGDDFNFFSQTFLLNYIIAVSYCIFLLLFKVNFESPRPNISYGCWINVVILLTISAFSLNREMSVFARFPVWLNIYTVLSIPLFLVYPYYKNFPPLLKKLVLLLTGGSLTLSVYMCIYLLPLLPVSCIGLILLGISVHSFVPFFWMLILCNFMLKHVERNKQRNYIVVGALLPLIFLGVYLYKWQKLQTQISDTIAEQNIKLGNQLPDDIYLAQRLPVDALTEEIMVSSYKAQRFWGDGMWINTNGNSKYHSPLSTVAVGLFGSINLDESTIESILKIRKDYRHITERKLWTGISLSTSAVSTNIQVFPEYRMAYHEKTITIHHDPQKEKYSWPNAQTQEALYTFHIPEGSIVTSLSLWINGKEQKSRLTTLQKADSAYTQIVGREQRDPAIVHWHEGNTITVRVFPCTPAEDRKFKIGFTTPLKINDTGLSLENIWFEGPDFLDAREVTQIIMGNGTKAIGEVPGFVKQANGNYLYKGDYLPHWQMRLTKPALSKNTFCFGGYQYALQEANAKQQSLAVKDVFLDITSAWTKEEFEALIVQLSSKNIYAWLPEKTQVNADNKDLVWENASRNQFSIPFIYDVKNAAGTVIITKTSYQSPVLSDLKQSGVAELFTAYLAESQQPLQVLNIGTELSPFWRSMRELRLINYKQCSPAQAVDRLLKGRFEQYAEDSTQVVISDSQLAITKTATNDSLAKGKAPDHLLRVFAYTDVLRKTGRHYFEKEKYQDALFAEAEEAYVVTPVTGMLVLETEADYARMGIGANKNTVGNATIVGGGAVPEPHEWVLIGLVALFIMRHLYKQRKAALAARVH